MIHQQQWWWWWGFGCGGSDDNDKDDDDSIDDGGVGSYDDFEIYLWNTVNVQTHYSLLRIHTIPSVPVVDCFQKIRQQVKCYLQMAGTMGKQELQEGLEVIESTNLKYFSREMTAEFYALKGMFLAQVGRSVKQSSVCFFTEIHKTLENLDLFLA